MPTCFWCHEPIEDGRNISGATSCDWMSDGGDFGCTAHPITGEEGTGPHETSEEVCAIIRAYHIGAEVTA